MRVRSIFEEIAISHDFEIDTLEVAEDHVHIFLSFPLRYSISRVVGILKGMSVSAMFRGAVSGTPYFTHYQKIPSCPAVISCGAL